jgi:prepilin signal peptidase PulO-like enzyme (type II secretory pathway)
MIEALISLAIVLPLTAMFSLFINKKLAPKWDSRENYGYKADQWKKPLTASIIVASLFTVLISFIAGTLFINVALGLLVFFLTATALTDAKSHLIPKELSNMALVVGLIMTAVGFATSQYYSADYLINQYAQFIFQVTNFGAYMFAVSLLFVVIMFAPVIGFGDIKMFWATGLFIGSFFVFENLLAVFMLMFIIMGFQLIFSMVKAKSWKGAGGLPALPAFAVAFVTLTLALNL